MSVILSSHPADDVLQITLNRPEQRNALTNEVLDAIGETLHDSDAHCAVITGNPQVFAAGADLKELAAMTAIDCHLDTRPELWKRIYQSPIPLIAAVNGLALGAGCELALHADIVIAGESARFGQPEITLGMIPGAGGTQRLIRAVGKSTAMRMVLAGEWLTAEQALDAGLISEITLDALTVETAISLASRIAQQPPLAVREARKVLLQAYETTLSQGLDQERRAFSLLADTADRQEGIAAFFDKRPAQFEGR